jgi:hypothetical protein
VARVNQKRREMAAYQEAVAAGFGAIVGIRDVFPEFSYRDIPSLRRGLRLYLKTNPLEVKFILGVMEIETWFIAEHTHLQKIDPILTPDLIKARLGFDPSIDDIQLRPHPTEIWVISIVWLGWNTQKTGERFIGQCAS